MGWKREITCSGSHRLRAAEPDPHNPQKATLFLCYIMGLCPSGTHHQKSHRTSGCSPQCPQVGQMSSDPYPEALCLHPRVLAKAGGI